MISEADMSCDEDRKLFKTLVKRGWDNTDKSDQRANLQRKVDTTCVNELLEWLENGYGDKPKSFLSHGLE